MNVPAGVALIVAGSGLSLVVVLGAWRRLPAAAALGAVGGAGLLVGFGAISVQAEASAPEWGLALAAIGLLAPVHARLVFGPPGRDR
jgi:hypothetical protein